MGLKLSSFTNISYKHALEMIVLNGGEVKDEEVRIKKQDARVATLEQNFEGLALGQKVNFKTRILTSETQEWSASFDGTGIVLRGRVGNIDQPNNYALTTSEETLDDYIFYIDEKLAKSMELPMNVITRAHELFYQYQLPSGQHTLKMVVKNPHDKVFIDIWDLVPYVDK